MLLLLPLAAILKGPPPAAIMEISVASEQGKTLLFSLVSCELSVENVRVFHFVSVTLLYSSDGPFNMHGHR